MNDLSAPPVPELSSASIAAHRNRLVREIATPHRRQVSRGLALRGGGAFAAVGAATAAVLVLFVGARAPNAFAGWSATPTRPASGQTASALSRCGAGPAGAAERWRPVLTDTRGPFTAMILQSANGTATCVTGPSFTTISANAVPGGAAGGILGVGSPAAAAHPDVSMMGSTSGPISQASQVQLTASGQPYTVVQGQVRSGVTGVTVVLSDGSDVRATVAHGSLVAWWPGAAHATAAHVTSGSAVTTQRLTFTPLPFPKAPSPTTSTNSSSSR
jgi:hypothetical protein